MFNFNRKEKGQGLVEYALILVLVAVVVIVVLQVLGPLVGNVFTDVNNGLENTSTATSGYNWSTYNPIDQSGCLALTGASLTYHWGNYGSNGEGCYFTINS